MMSARALRWTARLLILLLLIVLNGCADRRLPNEPRATSHPAPSVVAPGETEWLPVYYKLDHRFVVPLAVSLAKLPTPATVTEKASFMLRKMVEQNGPLPAGFDALLPKDTIVQNITYDEQTARLDVDFSHHVAQYNIEDERRIVEAIVWTLTGLPTVREVGLAVSGVRLREMPLDGLPLPTELNRSFGINLERAIDVDLSSSVPVTLFFHKPDDSGSSWLVPVTRFVPRSADREHMVFAQLLAGPLPGSELAALFPADLTAQDVTLSRKDEIVTVDWRSAPFSSLAQIPPTTRTALALTFAAQAATIRVHLQLQPAGNEMSAQAVDAPAQSVVQAPIEVPAVYNVWQ
jgi:germination protein M